MAPSVLAHTISFAYSVDVVGDAVQLSCPTQQYNRARRVSFRRVLMPDERGMGNMMNVLRMRREVRMMESVHVHGEALAVDLDTLVLELVLDLSSMKEVDVCVVGLL
jgi:hypothetical protein